MNGANNKVFICFHRGVNRQGVDDLRFLRMQPGIKSEVKIQKLNKSN